MVITLGGFIVSAKMLDMFKRPTDPPEFYHYYGIPAATTLGLYGIGRLTGKFPEIDAAAGTLSGLLCIGGIAGLASQATSRLGAVSGQVRRILVISVVLTLINTNFMTVMQAGVTLGVVSTMGHLAPSFGTASSLIGLMGVGAVAGKYIGDRVEPTSLPQTVAAFHSLVGLAAAATAVGKRDYDLRFIVVIIELIISSLFY